MFLRAVDPNAPIAPITPIAPNAPNTPIAPNAKSFVKTAIVRGKGGILVAATAPLLYLPDVPRSSAGRPTPARGESWPPTLRWRRPAGVPCGRSAAPADSALSICPPAAANHLRSLRPDNVAFPVFSILRCAHAYFFLLLTSYIFNITSW